MDRIRALRLLRQVATLGSFSAAARRERLPQPTVSRAIAALEQQLGARLLQRTTRRVGLTAAGRSYLDLIGDALERLEDADQQLRRAASRVAGRVRIAVPGALGRRVIAPALVECLRDFPDLSIEISVADRMVDVVRGGFDFAIRVDSPGQATFVVRSVVRSPQRMVASPLYFAERTLPRSAAELRGHAFVLRERQTPSELTRLGVTPRLLCDEIETAYLAALGGVGLSILPRWLVAEDLAAGRLLWLLRDLELPPGRIVAVSPSGRRISPAARYLLERLIVRIQQGVEAA